MGAWQEYKKEQKQKSIPVGPPRFLDHLSPLVLHLFLFAFFMKWGRLSKLKADAVEICTIQPLKITNNYFGKNNMYRKHVSPELLAESKILGSTYLPIYMKDTNL
jgi:hypothetical protein